MATGTATLNFGAIAAPTPRASVSVTGQGAIVGGSQVEAWLSYAATAHHSLDELREFIPLRVFAHTIAAGTGFTIEGEVAAQGSKAYGDFTINWAWL